MPTTKKSGLKRPRQSMPADVRAALRKRGLLAAYKARPAYQRNDYLAWIKGGQLKSTREKRLGQMLAELESGKKYMNMAWSGSRSRG
jgi:Bacteriocin-protection, YdeI or OmpD-Associated